MRGQLTTSQQAEALRLMRAGHPPQQEQTARLELTRDPWNRVVEAAYWAAVENELAIVRTVETENERRMHLRTLDDRPGLLVVTRTLKAPIKESAISVRVTIGRFEDDQTTAQAMRRSFLDQLERFTAKPLIKRPVRE